MPGTNIVPQHHFIKHCKNSQLIRENGVATSIFPWAFALRPADNVYPQEKWLSGQYLEFYDGTKDEKLCACCHFIPMEMKKRDALVRMNVALIKEQGQKRSRSLRVTHEPQPLSPGYSALHGLSENTDDELCNLLANLAIAEITEISSVF
jgi:hypothetical protein